MPPRKEGATACAAMRNMLVINDSPPPLSLRERGAKAGEGRTLHMSPKSLGIDMAQHIVTCFEILDYLIQLKIGR